MIVNKVEDSKLTNLAIITDETEEKNLKDETKLLTPQSVSVVVELNNIGNGNTRTITKQTVRTTDTVTKISEKTGQQRTLGEIAPGRFAHAIYRVDGDQSIAVTELLKSNQHMSTYWYSTDGVDFSNLKIPVTAENARYINWMFASNYKDIMKESSKENFEKIEKSLQKLLNHN